MYDVSSQKYFLTQFCTKMIFFSIWLAYEIQEKKVRLLNSLPHEYGQNIKKYFNFVKQMSPLPKRIRYKKQIKVILEKIF